MLRYLLAMFYSIFAFGLAYANDSELMTGTYNVTFQPIQIEGALEGCSLVFNAVKADFVYLNGALIVANGNISVGANNGVLALMLKVGIKELLGDKKMVRPNFAYLQTANYSTAGVQQEFMDGNEGYKLHFYPFADNAIMSLFDEMMRVKKVTLAFNREKGGMDVLIPIEFDIAESNVVGNKVNRVRTNKTMSDFTGCFGKLIEQAKSSLKK